MVQPLARLSYALVGLSDQRILWCDEAFRKWGLDTSAPEMEQWLAALRDALATSIGGAPPLPVSLTTTLRGSSGQTIQLSARPFHLDEGEVALLIAEIDHGSQAGVHKFSRDDLTKLPDRGALESRMAELSSRLAGAEPGEIALVFVDLDGFKEINDQFGHLVGDEVLATVAQRLAATIRGGDFIARFGGDEFVVLVEGAETLGNLEPLVTRLHEAIGRPVTTREGIVHLSASIGIALSTEGFGSVREMLAAADRRMYDQKRRAQQGGRLPQHPAGD